MLEFDLKVPQQSIEYSSLLELWKLGDELDCFRGAWLFDHIRGVNGGAGAFESWTLLAALAAQTSRLRVGVHVTDIGLRNPVLLACVIATVDHVSRGRVDVGLGAGWRRTTYEEIGERFPPLSERLERWDEACHIITGLLLSPEPMTFAGRHYAVRGARLDLRPVQEPYPPFTLGGWSDGAVAVVARHAHVWDVGTGHLAGLRSKVNLLRERCEELGRDSAAIRLSAQVVVDSENIHELPRIHELYARAGFSRIVLEFAPPVSPSSLELVADVLGGL